MNVQQELMGRKMYNYVLRKDWAILAKKLKGHLPSLDDPNICEPNGEPDDIVCQPKRTCYVRNSDKLYCIGDNSTRDF